MFGSRLWRSRTRATTQGEGAERTTEQWGFTRKELDQISIESQQRWGKTVEAGHYDDQLVPVETNLDGETVTVEKDEHPRPGTDVEILGNLSLAFREENEGILHAGNASGIVDGSATTLLASGEACEEFGWDPIARIVDTHVVGVDPITILTELIPATQEILERNDMIVDNIDRFEVNEAFASIVGAWLEETAGDWEKTNVWGGAIAHSHPLGATGTALLGRLPYQLEGAGASTVSVRCVSASDKTSLRSSSGCRQADHHPMAKHPLLVGNVTRMVVWRHND